MRPNEEEDLDFITRNQNSHNINDNKNHKSKNHNHLPACVYDKDVSLFRIFRQGGKILTAGYGVAYNPTTPTTTITTNLNHPSVLDNTTNSTKSSTGSATFQYLFIEEAIFLHERGLIQVYFSIQKEEEIPSCFQYSSFRDKKKKPNSFLCKDDLEDPNNDNNFILMDTQDLYTLMLQELHFPLPVYITYSYLRSQSYIVVRHFQQRLSILEKQQQVSSLNKNHEKNKIKKNGDSISKKRKTITSSQVEVKDINDEKLKHDEDTLEQEEELELDSTMQQQQQQQDEQEEDLWTTSTTMNTYSYSESLRIQLRHGTFYAPVPKLIQPDSTLDHNAFTSRNQDSNIAFHVYEPTSSYRKTNPGLPSILVAISYFHEPYPLSFSQLYAFTKTSYPMGIHLRIATVSDSGTVIMFGITDFGVPYIEGKQIKEEEEENKDLEGKESRIKSE